MSTVKASAKASPSAEPSSGPTALRSAQYTPGSLVAASPPGTRGAASPPSPMSVQSERTVRAQMRKAPAINSSVHHTPACPTTNPSRRKTTTPKMEHVQGTKTPMKVPRPFGTPSARRLALCRYS